MDLTTTLMLLGAGFSGGMLSSMVGGAAVITFPALLATGISPVSAIACNFAALVPANFLAAIDDRAVLPPLNARFIGIILASVAAASLGAVLLLATPERLFTILVPLLLGLTTVLFAFGGRIGDWLRRRATAQLEAGEGATPERIAAQQKKAERTRFALLMPTSLYGGYFGAGVGVLLIAVLSIGTDGDYRTANTTKNLVTSLNSLAATIYFALAGAVVWKFALIMLVGTLSGGLLGARLVRVVPRTVMRLVVVAVGALLTIVYAARYWF